MAAWSLQAWSSDGEIMKELVVVSFKNGSVMSSSQRSSLSNSLEAHILIQDHAYCKQQHTVGITKA